MFRNKLVNYCKDNGFDIQSAASEVDFAIEIISGLTSKDILLGKDIPDDLQRNIEGVIEQRILTGKPIQQILRQSFFMGEKFFVTEYTLIPRPESEIVVLECLKKISGMDSSDILDIGTGSGCLAIQVAKHDLNSKVLAVDICERALETAFINAVYHKVENRVKFKHSNLFSEIDKKFDVIISNPPYIPIKQKSILQKEVRDFEPKNALFANDNEGIEFYEKIISGSKTYLKENGYLIFELGINQSLFVKDLMTDNGFENIEVIKDLDKIDRVILGQR